MAPEVFMKTESGGHGRAADIWSVGCCVIEMASGRRPWAEFDSNYQIMFKVNEQSLEREFCKKKNQKVFIQQTIYQKRRFS